MIDQNRDGFIDNEDLKDMLASLGELYQIHTLSLPFSVFFLLISSLSPSPLTYLSFVRQVYCGLRFHNYL